ncbi:MAG: membrane protein insertase YidC [Candidatus Marinimicrobia bacterium]|nr:membrane protein insertase YidC [Candidatus Neomarinimicrobiota bacterium]
MNRQNILAIALIYLVFLFFIFPSMRQCAEPPDKTVDAQTTTITSESKPEKEHLHKPVPLHESTSAEIQTTTIQTNLLVLKLSNLSGGTITSAKIIEKDLDGNLVYPNNFADTRVVDMIPAGSAGNFSIRFATLGDSLDLSSVPFISTEINQGETVFVGEKPRTISFWTLLDSSIEIRRSFTFYPDRYYFDSSLDIDDPQGILTGETYEIAWKSAPTQTEENWKDNQSYTGSYILQGDEKPEKIMGKTNGDWFPAEGQRSVGQTRWIATRSKYFACAVVCDKNHPAKSGSVFGKSFENIEKIDGKPADKKFRISMFLDLLTLKHSEQNFQVYLGPLDFETIENLDPSLTQIMSFGWPFFTWIGRGILWVLMKLHLLIGNYGLSLVVFAFLVKIVLYFPMQKSYSSMEKMKIIQPEINKLKEKYKKDAAGLQRAQMELFKKHKVSPLGGCLPLLVQMPIFVSLFTVFRSTIVFRGESFLWIDDLSLPDNLFNLPFSLPLLGDSFNLLPLLMVVSFVLQQKLSTAKTADSQQKMMMYMMPAVFFFLFYKISAGLNLYYVLFNVLTILQQKFVSGSVRGLKVQASGPSSK